MANQLQESILKAADILVNNRINKMATDKTVTATIVASTNTLTGEYKVSYNGGFMTAYAENGETYNSNATVYVLVPEGDFTKKKIILGKATLTQDDANISFVSSALNDYNLIGKNVVEDKNNLYPFGLHSYLKEDYQILYQYGQDSDFLFINIDEFNNYISQSEALLVESSFLTRLPKVHRLTKTGIYGVQFVLAFKDGDATDEEGNPLVKYLSYTIDTNSMTGNPYMYQTWSDQYEIFPIDTENFLYVDSIMAFSKGFVEEDDKKNDDAWGADIFIKDLELYGLKKITGINGDYRLSISTPHGATFNSIQADVSLDVIAKTSYKINQDLSDSTLYYWFIEDGRVDASSEDYQMYGGAGWRRLKDKGTNRTLVLYGNENRAYINNYLCVAIYKESVILKENFTIYNEAARRNISIESDLGVKFSFDRGVPLLTCLIEGRSEDFEVDKTNPHKDEWFKFVWSKVDQYGQTITFNETQEELQERYEQGLRDGLSYSELVSIKNKITELQNVEFTRWTNQLRYPMRGVDTSAIFRCSVYLRDSDEGDDYFIGSAEIKLQNESAAAPATYYIVIENGDQVFQYSESGVAPDSDRYKDPLDVLPLACHFFDPAGIEVNNDTYSLTWTVPTESSMIVMPKEGMQVNPSNGKIEWFISEFYPLEIADYYDYSALNNQITCVVTYKGEEFTKDTRFYFGKVGDNGTNGTDVVAKIVPVSNDPLLDKEMLTLELIDGVAHHWNTERYLSDGSDFSKPVLDFDLYQRGELINTEDNGVLWSIAGNRTSYLTIGNIKNSSCALRWVYPWTEEKPPATRTQIVRANTTLTIGDKRQTYYAFYGIPIVNYNRTTNYLVKINYKETLKDIVYNADGRNPLYNKNQGVKLDITADTKKYIVWKAEGGSNGTNPNFKLIKGRDYANNPRSATKHASNILIPDSLRDEEGHLTGEYEDLSFVYILPDDVYDGAYSNNIAHGIVYTSKAVYDNHGNPEAEVYVPINMMLNTFGLASVNAWDGNHIEINEDGNYILAPQIGAGSKDENNRFTGVVMGAAETYGNDDNPTKPSVYTGLLGYSQGKQSIGLDATTGKAVFGLPENQASHSNMYEEGRIELVPGGTSKIANWRIGSRTLFNLVEKDIINETTGEVVETISGLSRRYSDLSNDYTGSIDHRTSGILLSALPSYISIKGRQLSVSPTTSENPTVDPSDYDIDNRDGDAIIKDGDTFELELNPNESSLFTIYRHTPWDRNNSAPTDTWRREAKVGIDNKGRFYSNSLNDEGASLNLNMLPAFGKTTLDDAYRGINIKVGPSSNNTISLMKMFTDTTGAISKNRQSPLRISGSSSTDNEYVRPMFLYGKELAMYASGTRSTSTTTNHLCFISGDEAKFGHFKDSTAAEAFPNQGISFPTTGEPARINNVTGSMEIATSSSGKLTVRTGNLDLTAQQSSSIIRFNTTSDTAATNTNRGVIKFNQGSLTSNFGQKVDTTANSASLNTSNYKLQLDTTTGVAYLGKSDMYLQMQKNTKGLLTNNFGWNIASNGNSPIEITTKDGNILMNANEKTRFSLEIDNGSSSFHLTSKRGSLYSEEKIHPYDTDLSGVTVEPGLCTPWAYFNQTAPGTGGMNVSGYGSGIIAANSITTRYGYFFGQGFVLGSEEWRKGASAIVMSSGGVKAQGNISTEGSLYLTKQTGNIIFTDGPNGASDPSTIFNLAWFQEIQRVYDDWKKSTYYIYELSDFYTTLNTYTIPNINNNISNLSGRVSALESAGVPDHTHTWEYDGNITSGFTAYRYNAEGGTEHADDVISVDIHISGTSSGPK